MLLFAAFRGPSDFLPFEPGARWTLENFRAIYSEAALYSRILPDTLIFVTGTVAFTFAVAFVLAWLAERTDLPGAKSGSPSSCFRCWCRSRCWRSRGSS